MTAPIHDRMSVIVDPNVFDQWLDPGMTDGRVVSEMLRPYDAWKMRCYPVSTRVNHTVNDDEECCRRIELAERQTQLFLSEEAE